MHQTLKKITGLFLIIVFASGCKKSSDGDEFRITLRLSHVFSPKEDLAISMEKVAKKIEKDTHGAVKILTYPQGQIATYKDGVELVARRPILYLSQKIHSYIGDYVPEFALVGPMLYRNFDEYTELETLL
ncbi:MAG: hypothetical protein R2827_00320 [Bdellovibrionales bacterium]